MAFETGYAANEFDLQQKLNAFILSLDGWTKISQPDVFDSVYFSSGVDTYKDIYIRTVAGLSENPAQFGGNQKDFGDGYVGFLNFFVYQYFPEGGDGYDGYGEAGRFGPWLMWHRGQDDHDVRLQRFSTAQAASNNRWNTFGRLYDRSDGGTVEEYVWAAYYTNATFDGKRYIYYTGQYSSFYRFDLATATVDVLNHRGQGQYQAAGVAYYIDPKTRKEYVWCSRDIWNISWSLSDDTTWDPLHKSSQLHRWNVEAGVLEEGFSGPEWTIDSGGEGAFGSGDLIWDGHNHLYMFRGNQGYQNDEESAQEWAKYHIPTDTWTLLTPLPDTQYRAEGMTWLDKKTSGFDYHRIYWASNKDDIIYYINIDENSGMPVGSWTSAGATPVTPSDGVAVFHNNVNRWYYYPGDGSTHGKKLYWAPMESGSFSWTLIDADYFPDYAYDNTTLMYIDGYGSRVRTALWDRTQYWFIGNADRIIVLTKADDQYSFCYMGAIDPYTSLTPHAITTANVYAGTNVEIPIDLKKGEFEVGQTITIADITETNPGAGEITGEVENIPRKFKPCEQTTTTHVTPGVNITVDELKNNYSAGSRIAFDPQPVGITLNGLDKIQMLNCLNTVNTSGGFDMAENIAHLGTVRSEVVNASAYDARRRSYGMWPIIIMNTGTMGAHSGEEIRGGLIGVFAVSNDGNLTTGDTIAVGGNTFMVFDVPSGQEFLYLFGPVAEEEE